MKYITKINKWLTNNIHRDYKDKTVVITGGSSGIGLYASYLLLSKGASLIWPVRNKAKAEEAKKWIFETIPNASITMMDLDLSSFDSIHCFANAIINQHINIDIFINNAGVLRPKQDKTVDGIDTVIGTNCIGVKLLNDLLFDYLKSLDQPVEVIFTSSVAAYMGKINYDDFMCEKHHNDIKVYSNSKLAIAQVFFDYYQKTADTNIKCYLTHPGVSYTPLIKKAYSKVFSWFAMLFLKTFFHSPAKACLPMLYALEKQESGAFYGPKGCLECKGYPTKLKIKEKLHKNQDKTIEIINSYLR